ncbi:hypothetical protein [Asticcacaulis taihuensis]|uniref:hypothetical protein n=1 Tax=Asticcacaulis taihuensis TaxID=260084 RepID=UPI0026EE73B5|nr:hypothetical protein [Asticcacaulis taihuensis]
MTQTHTQTQAHPHRPDLRRRAERLIAALDATPVPQTLPDIMRAARTLMVIDRLLSQLWKTPPVKSGRQPMAEPVDVAPTVPDDAPSPDIATTPPLNRHQRRLQAAQERNTSSDGKSIIRRETSSFPLSP